MTPRGTEAVFFDLDDTLVAFDAVAEISWRIVCDEYAALHPVASDTLRDAIRRRSDWYWRDEERSRLGRRDLVGARIEIAAHALGRLGLPESDGEWIGRRYSAVRMENMYLLPGAVETLERVRATGRQTALLTNGDGPTQRDKIERFDLERYFDAVFIEGELGYGKPDPRVYRGALAVLGIAPAHALMVGDNLLWDVAGAQAEGIAAVWVDRLGLGLPAASPAQPVRVIRGVEELIPILTD